MPDFRAPEIIHFEESSKISIKFGQNNIRKLGVPTNITSTKMKTANKKTQNSGKVPKLCKVPESGNPTPPLSL